MFLLIAKAIHAQDLEELVLDKKEKKHHPEIAIPLHAKNSGGTNNSCILYFLWHIEMSYNTYFKHIPEVENVHLGSNKTISEEVSKNTSPLRILESTDLVTWLRLKSIAPVSPVSKTVVDSPPMRKHLQKRK